VDIGVWMSRQTLAHKLEAQNERNTEQAWELTRWPKGWVQGSTDRLFVASGPGVWRGYFRLAPDALTDKTFTVYTLLFDTRTWTEIPPTVAVKHFRGFTYRVPTIAPNGSVLPYRAPPSDEA
jgi:hypothetical protein